MSVKSIVVCLGAGGVGKTTTAATLALHHARLGQKTLVITLDPAKRLMDALGISGKGDKPKRVDITPFMPADAPKKATLHAYMPDLKKEWMDFLTTSIERESVQKKIATNHFYQHMAEGIPGSLEIIAAHILFRIINDDDYDVIVLDTPPTSHSMSFFDVPKRVIAVLLEPIFQKLMKRRHSLLFTITKNIAFFSGGLIENTFERLIGSHFFSELLDFALSIDGLYAPMLERAKAMDELVRDSKTHYVLVVRPTRAGEKDMSSCISSLQTRGLKLSSVVINQIMPSLDESALNHELTKLTDEQRDAVTPVVNDYLGQQSYEEKLVSRMLSAIPHVSVSKLYKESDHDRTSLLKTMLADYERGIK